jgi:hypothetical protein
MTKPEYFDRANWVGRSSRLPIDAEEARRRHDAEKPYGVYFADLAIEFEVYFSSTYCGTNFLTSRGQPEVVYSFEKIGDRLFLFEADYLEYDEYGQRAARTVYYFVPEGTVRVTKQTPRGLVQQGSKKIDVSGNWEVVPSFGEVESLLRRER